MDHMESSCSTINGDTNEALKKSISAEVKKIFEDGAGMSTDSSYRDVDMISKDQHSSDDESAESVDVRVCDICGDAGREDSLAVCSKCKDGAEHTYCMRDYMDELPDSSWMCEECALSEEKAKMPSVTYERRKPINQLNRGGEESKVSGQKIPTKMDINLSRGVKASPSSSAGGISGNRIPTLMRKRTEEESKIGSSSISISRDHKASYPRDIAVSGKFSKSKSFGNKFSSPSSLRKTVSFNDAKSGRPTISSPRLQRTALEESFADPDMKRYHELRLARSSRGGDDPSQNSQSLASFDASEEATNKGGTNKESEEVHLGPDSDYAFYKQLAAFAFPHSEYIWRGQFVIKQNDRPPRVMYGIQAHLSTLASPNVPGAVKKFSSRISLEEVSLVNASPAQFQEHGPQGNSIGLYFFAEDTASYVNYRSLLQSMVDEDLALRGNVGGVEMLIFSSSLLPEGSRHWNGFLYLWGVFRGRKVAEQQMGV